MGKAGIKPQDGRFPGSLNALPDDVRAGGGQLQPPDGTADDLLRAGGPDLSAEPAEPDARPALAWAYVGLRIVHSLVQVTVNAVTLRFLVFVVSTIVLMVWTGCVAIGVVGS
jgi:hypothetical protein